VSNIAQLGYQVFLTPPIIPAFDSFETLVTFAAVIVVNYAIGDARTHWLEGLILIVIYILIGLSTWCVLFNPSFTRAFAHKTQVLSWYLVRGIRLTKDGQNGHNRINRDLVWRVRWREPTISYAANLDVVAIPIIVSYLYLLATWDFEALNCLLDSYESVDWYPRA
jgi:hypothetical protein